MKRYKAARESLKAAGARGDEAAAQAAKDERDALILFKSEMGAFVRLCTFLSQIFDYGNTGIEKRSIFYRHLLRLLVFGREREGIDLFKVVLTRHRLRNLGKRYLPLAGGDMPQLPLITKARSERSRQSGQRNLNVTWRFQTSPGPSP